MFEATEVEQRLTKAAVAGELLDITAEPDREVRAVVIRDLLRGRNAETLDPRGVRLRGARVVGELDLTDVRAVAPLVLFDCEHDDPISLKRAHLPFLNLTDSTFPALDADSFVCEHDVILAGIRSCHLTFTDGEITGALVLSGANLTATNDSSLTADGLVVGGSMHLDEGFTASSDSRDGTLRIPSATITGQLLLDGATLTATNGPALHADNLTINGNMHLSEGFTASSNSRDGALRLLGAKVTGQLAFVGATLTATNGPALHADYLTLGGSLYLSEGFTASSNSHKGTLRLLDATITGQLLLDGATLTATNGPALHADYLTLGGNLYLTEGFTASSNSRDGTLRLPGATITGQLGLMGSKIRSTGASSLVLHLKGAEVKSDLFMPLQVFSSETGNYQVKLDGLTYGSLPLDQRQEWLRLLAEHTPGYAAQPYQQLASVYRAAGHDRDVRRILIAQQRDHRRRGDLGGRGRKLLHLINGATIGYGHRPWRALAFLSGVCAVAAAIAIIASVLGVAVRPGTTAACSPAEAIGLAVDTAVPLLKLGGEKRCVITATTGTGQALYLSSYLLQALGWAFATLFVAGYTGLVRKSN